MPNQLNHQDPNKNSLGVAGFVLSCLGVLSLGLLSVPGFVLSLFGVFRKPRGLAIAGLVLGFLGSVFFVTVGMGLIVLMVGLGGLNFALGHLEELGAAFDDAETKVRSAYFENSDVTSQQLQLVIRGVEDPWDGQISVSRTESSFTLVSAGADKSVGTDDDISHDFRFVK